MAGETIATTPRTPPVARFVNNALATPCLTPFAHLLRAQADAGEDKNILVGTKGGWVDLQMDDAALPLEVRVVRKGGADDPTYLQKETALLLALLNEIEGVAENVEVALEKRLIVLPDGVLETARQQLTAGPASESSSEDSVQYAKAMGVLAKKAKFEKISEAMGKIQKGFLK